MTVTSLRQSNVCVFASFGTGALAAPLSAGFARTVWFASGTTNGNSVPIPDPTSTAARIGRLKVNWALTWDQVAALLGVSRRSVHAWVAGNPVRTRNLDRLTAVENRLGLPDMSTAVNHHRLFSGNPAAPSLFARLLADTQVSSPSKAADLLGGTVDAPMIRGRQLTGAEWQLPGE